MSKKGLSRRELLKIAAVASVAGSTSGFLAPSLKEAWAHGKGRHEERNELRKTLEKILKHKARGVERNNQIPRRLASNLARIGGRSPEIVEARRRLLLRATEAVEEAQKKGPHNEKRTVTQNLNDLLDAVQGQSAPTAFKHSLINALIVTVLFATHGTHFPDTRDAHRQFRQALLALKNRSSTVYIGTRITNKRNLLEIYRRATASRRRQISSGGHFPEEVTIRSVWIMPRPIET